MARTTREAKVWGRHLTRAAEKKASEKAAAKPAVSKFRLSSTLRDEIALSPFSSKKLDKFRQKSSSPRVPDQQTEENQDPRQETEKEDASQDNKPVPSVSSPDDILSKTKLKVVVKKNDGESRFMKTFSADSLEGRTFTHSEEFDQKLVSRLADEDGVHGSQQSPLKSGLIHKETEDSSDMDEGDYRDDELPEEDCDRSSDDEELDVVCGSPVGMTVDEVMAADGDIIPDFDLGSESEENSDAASSWESDDDEEETIGGNDLDEEFPLSAPRSGPSRPTKPNARKLDEEHVASVPGPSSKRPKLLSDNFVRLNMRNKRSMSGAHMRSKTKMKQHKIEKRFFRRVSSMAAQADSDEEGGNSGSNQLPSEGGQNAASASSSATKPVMNKFKRRGKCFSCGKSGHWVSECPLRQKPFAESAEASCEDDLEVMEVENSEN